MNDEIDKLIEILHSGGLILYPTDTVWGIGCDATNETAVEKIYRIKKRAETKSMLVLTDSPEKLDIYVEKIPTMAWELIKLAAKPLTIIYPKGRNLARNLVGEDGSIGIRITCEEFSKKICERFQKPIVSTSANVSGEKSPTFFDEISNEIKNGVDYIVHYRRNDKTQTLPSSIVKLDLENTVKIIRE
ncbi:MAG: L-threonylcarbamoyladenylate synthase [Paludibacteraceae bacterium]